MDWDRETDPIPSADRYLRAVFDHNGYLAAEFEGYKLRRGQVALARAVDRAIRREGNRGHLIAEGPTGTGKSLAYLVPATYHAATEGSTVVVATANIALQEQLTEKDLPLLQKILPWKLEFALLKGIGNFLCLDELEDFCDTQAQLKFAEHSRDDRAARIIEWAEETATGDRNELPFEPGALWSKFSTSSDDCMKDKCKHSSRCFALAAQRRAKQANVIVTNYHLLFADILVQMKTDGMVRVIPPYSVAIFDEAHKAPDIARNFFGFRFTARGISRCIRKRVATEKKEGIARGIWESIEGRANEFFFELGDYYRSKSYKTRLKQPCPVSSWKPLVEELHYAHESMAGVALRLDTEIKKGALFEEQRKDYEARKRVLELGIRQCKEYEGGIFAAMHLKEEPDAVYFIEEDRKANVALVCKTVDVAPILREQLFEKINSVTLTSATLATNGDFSYIEKETGAPKDDTCTLIAETPFSHEQSLLIVPGADDIPLPTDREAYPEAVPEVVEKIVKLAHGRTLALFTSYKNLRASAEWLRGASLPYQILVQGERPRTQLLAEFKEDESSVLLGTESFWAGVDAPGPTLSCVIIDRLPFPTPDDPVLDAISAHDDRWFFTYSIPRAQIQLKQGAGRLIRSVSDRGVIVVLDRRIIEKSYGASFMRSLPRMMRSRVLDNVYAFLEQAKP